MVKRSIWWSVTATLCISLFCIGGYFSLYQYRVLTSVSLTPKRFHAATSLVPRPLHADSNLSEETFQTQIEAEYYIVGCELPYGGYKAWNQGVVTLMKPSFPRNCSLLFQRDAEEIKRVQDEIRLRNGSQFEKEFYDQVMFGKCAKIRSEFMNNLYSTRMELNFPLAFSMTIHENPQQIWRLLKVIYRPHNLYCLHYDQKSSNLFKKVMQTLSKCLGNVFIPKTIVNVVWGCHTLLESQVSCMKALYSARNKYPWKYAITLCGKELPLRTNREIVETLRRLNGTAVVPFHSQNGYELRERFTFKHVLGSDNKCQRTKNRLGPVPYGLEIKKNMAFVALPPEFVHFIFHNKTALDLYEYMKEVFIAEEQYYATVFWMKSVPGGYNKRFYSLLPTVAEYVWAKDVKCNSLVVHDICIISSADLYQVKYKVDLHNVYGPLFHNKYFMEKDHTVMDCLEEQLVIRNKREYTKDCSLRGTLDTR